MIIEKAEVGVLSTNCYVFTDEAAGESAVVDTGGLYRELETLIQGKNIKYILLTHGHYDHILGVAAVKRATGAKVVIGENDADCLYDTKRSMSGIHFPDAQEPAKADITVNDGDELYVGSIKVKVMASPGHSAGSVCYVLDDENVIFSGDTLFYRSAGRTDFPSGSSAQMRESLKKLSALDKNYKVYPGHGQSTSLADEKKYNIFMR